MSNRLKPVQVEIIRRMWHQGWKNRAIARSTGVNRNTVNRYVQQWRREAASAGAAASCESNAAKLHTGSAHDPPVSFELGGLVAGANEANLHLGSGAMLHVEPNIQAEPNGAKLHPGSAVQVGTHSLCWPHREIIQSKLDQGLTAQRIHQDLRTEHGFTGSYFSVLRFVQRLQPRQELPFRRMEVIPGDEVQVDFGQGAWIVDGEGKKRRPHLFRMVLSHSRRPTAKWCHSRRPTRSCSVWRMPSVTLVASPERW